MKQTTRKSRTVKTKKRPNAPKLTRRRARNRLHVLKFLPALLIFGLSLAIYASPSLAHQTNKNGVLSYATNVSISDLLNNTNIQRGANGASGLSLNQKLINAAQAKANDMVARNYWAHVTPDGQQPWAFIANAGYSYTAAGENLAYGFANSADTVTGWMNSPSHKANLLNTAFTEVGFGIANSANFVGDGEQTVVVAMYANPQPVYQPAAPAAAPPTPQAPAAAQQTVTETPVAQQSTEPVAVAEESETQTAAKSQQKEAVSTTSVKSASSSPVRRVQLLTGGHAAWSATAIIASICALGIVYTFQRGARMKRLMLAGEKFILHHVYLDVTVLSLVALAAALLSTVGNIR